ncbi:hypothetical protein PC9H_001894 [Pleurotus ostreatus]|uniref:Uncharacterized protein n=1 Tax=Pleurotus ostreatus TaxID=5322 RepID=A0A8H6ZJU7_PLEOS|nr:uncharacterized protein PC9H_001894 [Pleurotus ostreatus]KAF7419307.1 hypothetical protein PC9H_001894 [Pleurotus ostreatus]KAJ8689922.1 hypothetical protein PTI98_012777 [Pleurotus ostreatus]
MLVHSWIVALVLCVHSHIRSAEAQQIKTNGLAKIDSPQPDTFVHNHIVIAVDVDVSQAPPQSGIDSLEIYLISVPLGLNLTVAAGPTFLNSEPTSTVKHLDYFPPSCAKAGDYELTFYEASHEGDQRFFDITPIRVRVDQTEGSSTFCDATPPQASPESIAPPPLPPLPDGPDAPFVPSPPEDTPRPSDTHTNQLMEPLVTSQESPNSNPTMTSAPASASGTATLEGKAPTSTADPFHSFVLLLPVSGARTKASSCSTVQLMFTGVFVPLVLVVWHASL